MFEHNAMQLCIVRSPCGIILSCGLLDKVMATSIAVRLESLNHFKRFFFDTAAHLGSGDDFYIRFGWPDGFANPSANALTKTLRGCLSSSTLHDCCRLLDRSSSIKIPHADVEISVKRCRGNASTFVQESALSGSLLRRQSGNY